MATARCANGFSLIELMAVVAVLGTVAAAVTLTSASHDGARIDLVAGEIAGALRFARGEAIRTGQPYGVGLDPLDNVATFKQLTVFKVDLAAVPFGNAGAAYHPVDKLLYDRDIVARSFRGAVAFTGSQTPFSFDGLATPQHWVHFNAQGRPVYYDNRVARRLTAADLQVGDGRDTRIVDLDPITGHVAIY